MRWRLLFISTISLLILSGTAYAASAKAATNQLGLPKKITITQIVSLQKMQATWQEPAHAKKYIVKLFHGKTLVFKRTVKDPHITFAESKLADGESYSLRVRAKATEKYKASAWQKKKFIFDDLDLDNDGIVNEDDIDDDADGIPDTEDTAPKDHDNDGVNDGQDSDDDNDLQDDVTDEFPLDHDNDGDPDETDPDDDNDGILDGDEVPGQQFDEDNDGVADYLDEDYIAEHQVVEVFTIRIKNNDFVEGDITIAVGDTVQWVNKDEGGHAVAATDGSFESPPLQSGESYSYTFETAGTYDYYDPTAPDLQALTGTITVE